MNMNDLIQRIHEHPYDNAPRLAFADLIESSDAARSAYIRSTIATSERNRLGEYGVRISSMERPTPDQVMAWARYLMPYVRSTRDIFFHRGFPIGVAIQPASFIEYGDDILRAAPIRHVRFIRAHDEDGKEIPGRLHLEALLACPHLAKLDTIEFDGCLLPLDAPQQFSRAETLRNCLYLGFLDVSYSPGLTYSLPELILGLASGDITRRMLSIGNGPLDNGIAIEEHQGLDEGGYFKAYTFREEGKTAEREHGYIPWLHERPGWVDLRWHFEQGHYPKIPVGTKPPRDEWYQVPPKQYERSERW